jgi:NADPH oxidase
MTTGGTGSKVKALYAFTAEMPNEVSIRPGDIITIVSQDDEGWWEGEVNGQTGMFPSNYVTPYEEEGSEQVEGVSASQVKVKVVSSPATKRKSEAHIKAASIMKSTAADAKKETKQATAKPDIKQAAAAKGSTLPSPPQNGNNKAAAAKQDDIKTRPASNSRSSPLPPAPGGADKKAPPAPSNASKPPIPNGEKKAVTMIPAGPQNKGKSPDAAAAAAEGGEKKGNIPIQRVPASPRATTKGSVETKNSTISSPTYVAPRKELKTRFGQWGSNLAVASGFAMFWLGWCAVAWGIADENLSDKVKSLTAPVSATLTPLTGVYSIILGLLVIAYEHYFGQSRDGNCFPLRGIVYILASGFMYLSYPTFLCGIFLSITGIVNCVAALLEEEYSQPIVEGPKKADPSIFDKAASCCDNLQKWLIIQREQNKVGVLVFVGLYVSANVIIFALAIHTWVPLAAAKGLSGWAPLAKAFGNLLDFNCAMIVVPVLRTCLRALYNKSTADQSCIAQLLRFLLQFVPIDKNIAFHKIIARVVVFATVGHTFMHFINYCKSPINTFRVFGLWPWVSGGLICIFMLMIYTTAPDNTKRGQFELFWYNHHFFILFFIFILLHGAGGFNPNFWKWFLGPGSLYCIERLARFYRSRQKVVILSVTIMKPDVFSLEFAKEGVLAEPYNEGMYLFLQSPPISAIQWHPFTISSAPQENSVTVHIRNCGPGSWTNELQQYLSPMGAGKPYFTLDRPGPNGKIQGKILGPDSKQMICIDGPHSAPTQHMGEYSQVMIIGAGIGVTPVSSTLKSIVYFKWKFGMGACFPDHAYFYWVCAYKDVSAFRWLIRIIKDAQDEVVHMRTHNPQTMATKTFEFHIFVTSAPKDAKAPDVVVDDEIGFWGVPYKEEKVHVEKTRADFSLVDLYKAMLAPAAHQQLEDIHIWNGRPNWDSRFEEISKAHPQGEIGVAFCGNPMIGKDLKNMCFKHSRGRAEGIFKLHKENF